jgi:hypothetical protein
MQSIAEENKRLREALEKIHAVASRALAEPPDNGSWNLVEICTLVEKALSTVLALNNGIGKCRAVLTGKEN